MKIAATSVSMDAARTYKEVEQRQTGLHTLTGIVDTSAPLDDFSVRLSRTLASSSQTQLFTQSVVSPISKGSDSLTQAGDPPAVDPEKAVSQLAEQVLGQPITIRTLQENPAAASPLVPLQQARDLSFQVRGAALVSSTLYSQEETQMFSARGSVQTTDGREIAFDLGFSMERNTVAVNSASMGMSTLFIDPLILQFDTASPLLSDSSFLFDLDSNGTKEQLACPGGGCGFLAFDRNSDGSINNGLELFGPGSGSGFGELAELDSDANQWIDENDPLFDQLSIWSQDGQGGESLLSLRAAGVGAISVLHAGTDFQLQNPGGDLLGTLKASGIFLTEAGEVRSLQEVDLALPAAATVTEGALPSGENKIEVAMQALRTIISMQRFRLRMMLTGQRLQQVMAKKEEQREWLFTWQHTHREWPATVVEQSETSTPDRTDGLPASPHRQRAAAEAKKTLERGAEWMNLGLPRTSRDAPLMAAQRQRDPAGLLHPDGRGRLSRRPEELNQG